MTNAGLGNPSCAMSWPGTLGSHIEQRGQILQPERPAATASRTAREVGMGRAYAHPTGGAQQAP